MLTLLVDPHTHTLFSGHAFSTIEENARHAAEKGLQAIGMTDHFWYGLAGEYKTAPNTGPALNMEALPREIHGVRVLAGVEIDIVDFAGNLAYHDFTPPHLGGKSLCSVMLDSREVAVASLHHFEGCRSGSKRQNTEMYCAVVQNPGVDILGHPERTGIDWDLDEVLLAAKAGRTLIEINEHSLDYGEKGLAACRRLALRCAELAVPIAVSSDAHSAFAVGVCSRALALLEEIGFPEELVANRTLATLQGFLA